MKYQTRKLKAKWSLEAQADLHAFSSPQNNMSNSGNFPKQDSLNQKFRGKACVPGKLYMPHCAVEDFEGWNFWTTGPKQKWGSGKTLVVANDALLLFVGTEKVSANPTAAAFVVGSQVVWAHWYNDNEYGFFVPAREEDR